MDNLPNRLCIFLTARSGSSFVRYLFHEEIKKPHYINSSPRALVVLEDSFPGQNASESYVRKIPEIEGKEIYPYYVPIGIGKKYLDTFPGRADQWRFAYILRDPRNRIASYLGWRRKKDDETSHIERLCNSFKKTAAGLLEIREDNRFYLIAFENYIKDTFASTKYMLNLVGVEPDEEYFKNRISTARINSSFGDDGKGAGCRWQGWCEQRKGLVKSLIGQELISMGYEKDFGW